jgi:uncharacterized protein (DUF302 family)
MALVTTPSPDGVRATGDRLAAALERRGVRLFARIDHGAGAREAGLELADEEVLIFGDPRVGTLLMQSEPALGYELPMRMLVRDAGGTTVVSYRPIRELAECYGVSDREEVLERIEALQQQLAAEAAAAA